PGRDREIDTGSVLQVTTGSPTGPTEGRPGKGSHRRPDGNLLAFASQASEQDTAREPQTGPLYGSHRRRSSSQSRPHVVGALAPDPAVPWGVAGSRGAARLTQDRMCQRGVGDE